MTPHRGNAILCSSGSNARGESRELLGGTEENSVSPTRGHQFALHFYQPRSGMVMQNCRSKEKKKLVMGFLVLESLQPSLDKFWYFLNILI